MQPPSKSKTWANGDSAKTKIQNYHSLIPSSRVLEGAQNDEEYDDVPDRVKKNRVTDEATEYLQIHPQSTTTSDPYANTGVAVENTSPLPHDAAQISTDEDWLRSRTSRLLGLEDTEDPLNSISHLSRNGELSDRDATLQKPIERKLKEVNIQTEEEEPENGDSTPISPSHFKNDNSASSGRLFVRNLSYKTTEEDLKGHFEIDGTSIIEVRMIIICETVQSLLLIR